MKNNDYALVAATAGYSYLFFEQNAGINFLIFSVLFISILIFRNGQLVKEMRWLWAAAMCIFSAVCIFLNSSALSIIANCVSLLLLSAFSVNTKTSAIFSFLFSLFSVVSSLIYIMIDSVNRSQVQSDDNSAPKKGYKFIAVSLVFILCISFFVMYKNANPLFAENTKWINLDFISLNWLSFTFGGILIVYGLYYHRTIPVIENWENNLPENNNSKIPGDQKRAEAERFSGIILFVFLNLMLIVLNAGDISSIWFNGTLPKGVSHSDFVHNGVGMIILSIVVATSLIMFLFRKNFSSIRNYKAIKLLIFIWIIQNLVMLFSTTCRNQIYIETFNLTYKRIGVYVWLSLAAVGLVIAFVKVLKERSNWFLIRANFALWFSVLVLSSVLNWDVMITRYNLNNKPIGQVDFYYLFSLSDSNIPELLRVTKKKDFELVERGLKNYTNDYDDPYYRQDYFALLNGKIRHFLNDYTGDWRSFDLRDVKINNSLRK